MSIACDCTCRQLTRRSGGSAALRRSGLDVSLGLGWLFAGARVEARYCTHDKAYYAGKVEQVHSSPGLSSVKYTVVWDEDGSVTSNIPASRVRAAL